MDEKVFIVICNAHDGLSRPAWVSGVFDSREAAEKHAAERKKSTAAVVIDEAEIKRAADSVPDRSKWPHTPEWPPVNGEGQPLEIGQRALFVSDAIDPASLGCIPEGREEWAIITEFSWDGYEWGVSGENDNGGAYADAYMVFPDREGD